MFADPCSDALKEMDPQPGPTVDDLAAALAHLPGITATAPMDAAVADTKGKKLSGTTPTNSRTCEGSASGYALWRLPLGYIFAVANGQRMAIWIVDVQGMRLVVSLLTGSSTPAKEQAAARSIVDSIRIANPN